MSAVELSPVPHPLCQRRRGHGSPARTTARCWDRLGEDGQHNWVIRHGADEFLRVQAEAVAAVAAGADLRRVLRALSMHNAGSRVAELVALRARRAAELSGEIVWWGAHTPASAARPGRVTGRTVDGGVVVETLDADGAVVVEEWDAFTLDAELAGS